MIKAIKYLSLSLLLSLTLACESALEPLDENLQHFEDIISSPATAEGLLINAYNALNNQYKFSCVATDDAVSNQVSNGYRRLATGELSSRYNPANEWAKYKQIFYLNQLIPNISNIVWTQDSVTNIMFERRIMGEALAMRGLFHLYALQAHAGKDDNGHLLGIPYYSKFIPTDGDFTMPRLDFKSSVDSIIADFDTALLYLPEVYSNNESDRLEKDTIFNFEKYKVVYGTNYAFRISGRAVKAYKARLALMAASPAFLNEDGTDPNGYYQMAAQMAGEILDGMSLDVNGLEFYDSEGDEDLAEILWRGTIKESSGNEKNNYPPSLNGNGRVNPSQDLVNAFPLSNGYPIDQDPFLYDENDPYANRDPRLTTYILVNGGDLRGTIMNAGLGGGTDRVDSIPERSTRTGYYLKKLLRPDVVINNSGKITTKNHFNVYLRYTEVFLILAEAANEIGGPDQNFNGHTPESIISKLRTRAGLPGDFSNGYLATIGGDKDKMRELIQNERRLELCFEGFRLWDMRRWKTVPLDKSVSGLFFDGQNYISLNDVESRIFTEDGRYFPIPYNETLKFDLIQNKGW